MTVILSTVHSKMASAILTKQKREKRSGRNLPSSSFLVYHSYLRVVSCLSRDDSCCPLTSLVSHLTRTWLAFESQRWVWKHVCPVSSNITLLNNWVAFVPHSSTSAEKKMYFFVDLIDLQAFLYVRVESIFCGFKYIRTRSTEIKYVWVKRI